MWAGFPLQPHPQLQDPLHLPRGGPSATGSRVGLTIFIHPPPPRLPWEALHLLAVHVYPCSGNLGFMDFISCTVSPLATLQSLRSIVITSQGWPYKFSPFLGLIFETRTFHGKLLTVDRPR